MIARHPHGRIPVRTARRAARILAKASNPINLENLERRQLLASIGISSGLLDVVLDNGRNNSIYLRNNNGGTAYIAELNGTNYTLNKNAIDRIRITGGDRNDYIDISQSITRPSTIIGNGGNDEIKGGSGNDLIFTGSGNDRILGRAGNDTIVSGAGRDSVYGGDGSDYLYTTGNGELHGEGGNDFLDGGSNGALFGGGGTDTGNRGRSFNSIERRQAIPAAPTQPSTGNSPTVPQGPTGLPSQMTLASGTLAVTMENGRNNSFYIRNGSSSTSYLITYNGANYDVARSDVSRIRVDGGDRNDNIDISSSLNVPTTLNGGAGNDTIKGGSGPDLIDGGAGSDYILARDGNDTVRGGGGSDSIWGGNGDDYLYGSGNGRIYGEAGNDFIDGGGGSSVADGGAGTDTANNAGSYVSIERRESIPPFPGTGSGGGNTGGGSTPSGTTLPTQITLSSGTLAVKMDDGRTNSFYIRAGSTSTTYAVTYNGGNYTVNRSDVSRITVDGGDRADNIDISSGLSVPTTLNGGGGNDTIKGGSGPDLIDGGAGNDTIQGRDGNDTIRGGGGADSISGGNGNDYLYGSGNGRISGDAGDDFIDGGGGSSIADGGAGRDTASNAGSYVSIEVRASIPPFPGTGTGGGGGGGGGTTDPGTGGGTPQTPGTEFPINGTVQPGGSYPASNSASNPTAVINRLSSTIAAGQAIHVDALSSTLRAGTPITARYEWDFGDPNGRFNRIVGFNAAHVYDTPGTYKITLRVFNEAGGISTTSTNITVTAANRQVIYVSPNGNDNNSGTSPSSPIKSFSKAVSIAANNRSNLEILFQRGGTYSTTETMGIGGNNVRIGAYGSGANPRLVWAGEKNRNVILRPDAGGRDVMIEGLTFDSIWTSTNGSQTGMPIAIKPNGTNVTVRNNTFLNVGFAVNANGQPTGVLVQDNDAPLDTGLRDYFVWAAGESMVILGNKVSNVTREHTVRASQMDKILVAYNELQNKDRSATDRYDVAKGVIVIQQGSYAYVAHNIAKGPVGVGPLGQGDGLSNKAARWRHAVFEGNRIEGYTFEVLHGSEHSMLRNNVLLVNDGPSIKIEGYNSTYGRGVVNAQFFNNTAINTGSKGHFIWLGGGANGLKVANNLYRAPNMYPGTHSTSAMYVRASNLGSFDFIRNNVWPSVTGHWWAEGGIHWVGTNNVSASYQSPNEWAAFSQTSNEHYQNVSLASNFAPTGGSRPTSSTSTVTNAGGVFADFYGKYRFSNATIGAVQA